MRRLAIFATVLGLSHAVQAEPLRVASGCSPLPSALSHRFYVDPQRGSQANDGSEAKPWRTLAEVVDPANHLIASQSYVTAADGEKRLQPINPDPPIKPGDVIYLFSGDHGPVSITGLVNSSFITVEAAPGQTPVIDGLKVEASSHWIFRGLHIQAAPVPASPSSGKSSLVSLGDGPLSADNIIIDSNTLTTAADSSAWSDADWNSKPYTYGAYIKAPCTTLFNNHLTNVRNAVAISSEAEKTVLSQNLIEDFEVDGIDTTASDVIITGNTIRHGRHHASDPDHADGIQGWTTNGATNSNVVIERNTIISNQLDGEYLQGISIFDGKWDNVTVANNVVVTNHWNGIVLFGVANSRVLNNTVVASDPKKYATWISVWDNKDHSPSRNVLVRNNIAPQFTLKGENITWDHNIAEKLFTAYQGERPVRHARGTAGDGNLIRPNIFSTFKQIDNVKGEYDLQLKPNNPAVRAGSSVDVPLIDMTGKPRVSPFDIGAFSR